MHANALLLPPVHDASTSTTKTAATPPQRYRVFGFVFVVLATAAKFADVSVAVLKSSATTSAWASATASVLTVLTDDADGAANDTAHGVAATASVTAG